MDCQTFSQHIRHFPKYSSCEKDVEPPRLWMQHFRAIDRESNSLSLSQSHSWRSWKGEALIERPWHGWVFQEFHFNIECTERKEKLCFSGYFKTMCFDHVSLNTDHCCWKWHFMVNSCDLLQETSMRLLNTIGPSDHHMWMYQRNMVIEWDSTISLIYTMTVLHKNTFNDWYPFKRLRYFPFHKSQKGICLVCLWCVQKLARSEMHIVHRRPLECLYIGNTLE